MSHTRIARAAGTLAVLAVATGGGLATATAAPAPETANDGVSTAAACGPSNGTYYHCGDKHARIHVEDVWTGGYDVCIPPHGASGLNGHSVAYWVHTPPRLVQENGRWICASVQ